MVNVKKIISNKKVSLGLIAILLVLLTLSVVNSCDKSNDVERVKNNMQNLEQEVEVSESKMGQVVSKVNTLNVTNKELQNQIWVKDDSLKDITRQFKRVISATVIETKVVIDTVDIPFKSEVESVFSRDFSASNPNYSIQGIARNTGISLSNITIINKQRIVIGKDRGFFRDNILIKVTNSNKKMHVIGMTSQNVVVNKKRFGLGPFIGLDHTGSATFGVALTYSLIRF